MQLPCTYLFKFKCPEHVLLVKCWVYGIFFPFFILLFIFKSNLSIKKVLDKQEKKYLNCVWIFFCWSNFNNSYYKINAAVKNMKNKISNHPIVLRHLTHTHTHIHAYTKCLLSVLLYFYHKSVFILYVLYTYHL